MIFLTISPPASSSIACQIAGTSSRCLSANSSTSAASVARYRKRGRPRLASRCACRSTKPAATRSLSCSVTAVRVTPTAESRLAIVCGGRPTNSFTIRRPAAVMMASDMVFASPPVSDSRTIDRRLQIGNSPERVGVGVPAGDRRGNAYKQYFIRKSVPIPAAIKPLRISALKRSKCGPKGTVPFSLTRKSGQSPVVSESNAVRSLRASCPWFPARG